MKIRWLRHARRQLDEAGEYSARDNPKAAERMVRRIRLAVENLADFPMMGRAGRVIGTRELVVPETPYIVAYRVREQVVEVLAVHHGARRWPESFD
ncbi:MAG: type II toxin-antitoxin system RelE/ParE family toxin [Chloroflexota bacterium]